MTEPDAFSQIHRYGFGFSLSRAIYAVADVGVPDALGDGAETADALAQKVGVHPDALFRLLRLLSGHGIFCEEGGHFTHTEQSRLLRSDHPQSQRAFIRINSISWKLFAALPQTLRTGRPATETLAPGGLFEYLGSHPDEARVFNEAMTSKANMDIGSVLHVYDFSGFPLIADVGGGRGHLIKAILKATPNAKGILFDLPQVASESSGAPFERLSVQGGDFFKSALPVCDAYLLMQVIHDWADPEAVSILEAVRRAAPAHAKLLVIETLMPEKPAPGPVGAHPAVWLDVAMLVWSGGRERSLRQYEVLLGHAGFNLSRVIPTQSGMSLLECTPRASAST